MSKSQEILILVNEFNNRVQYLFRHVFAKTMGLRPVFTNDKEAFLECITAKLNYSNNRLQDELFIRPSGLLYQKGIKKLKPHIDVIDGIPVIFKNEEDSDFDFDVFSAIFYVMTRYQEYLPFSPDKHNRFKIEEDLFYNSKFTEEPIVDIWIDMLKDFLKKRFPQFEYTKHRFQYIPTVDVDMAFAYKFKGTILNSILIVRDLLTGRLSDLSSRIKAVSRLGKDPYDNFDYLREHLENKNAKSIFFFLSGKRGKFDKNTSLKKTSMQKIIKDVAQFADLGLHPSYASNKKALIIDIEKQNLESVVGICIHKSRQHFLKITLPQTYQNLIKAGITEDYSLGYASLPAFRPGTCRPFNFYDLTKERETEIKVFPFQAMDATFKSYMHLSPSEAEVRLLELRDKVKKHNGNFIVIWHNDTFSNTPEGLEWRKVFEKLLTS